MDETMQTLTESLAVVEIPNQIEQAYREVRLYAMVLTGSFLWDEAEPIFYILSVPTSTFNKVVAMTHAPDFVAALLCLAFVATLPHFLALLIFPKLMGRRLPRVLACSAAVVLALIYFYLANLAWPLDIGPLPWLYMRAGLGALVMAFLYAVSLNAQQLRSLAARLFK